MSTHERATPDDIEVAARVLSGHPEDVMAAADLLDDAAAANLGEVLAQLARQRAVDAGNHDAIIAAAFETGFGRDGLAHLPWVEGSVIVCPGGLISNSKSNHTCRFISVDDTWVWESSELILETKRSTPGPKDGFRAVALVPIIEGMELDVVSGKARSGQHSVDKVVSFEVRKGQLHEVSQRTVKTAGMK